MRRTGVKRNRTTNELNETMKGGKRTLWDKPEDGGIETKKKEEGGGNKNGKKEKQRHIGYCFGLGEGRGFESVRALDRLKVKQEEGKLFFKS